MSLSATGFAIANFRKSRGMRQYNMAILMDTSPAYLSAIERGKRPLTPKLRRRMFAYLDFTEAEQIQFDKDSKNGARILGASALPVDDFIILCDLVEAWSPRIRAGILALLNP